MAYSHVQNTTDTLGIGSRAPDFRLTAVNTNKTYSLAELIADSPVILEFMRGTWCHNCRKRMPELELLKDDIKAAGTKLVYIAAEKAAGCGIQKNSSFRIQFRILFCWTETVM